LHSTPSNPNENDSDDDDTIIITSKSYRKGSLMAATAAQGRVPYGEESLRYRRTEFAYDDWVQHRTSEKIITNLKGLFYSGVVRQLKEEILLVALSATVVVFWNQSLILTGGDGSASWISLLPRLTLPALPFTLCSPALGLLLVFKTNASYARWSEARNTWARIIAQARNIVRMAAAFVPKTEEGKMSVQNLSNAVYLLCRSIMSDLSGPNDEACYINELEEIFSSDSLTSKSGMSLVENMIESPDRAIAALAYATRTLDSMPIDEKRRVEIDKSLVIIGDCIGTCEKIYSSPVPLVYTRHTGRFLSLWMILLPAALYDVFVDRSQVSGSFSLQCLTLIPASAVLGLFLFGIDELAIQLEEPFSILPMQKFCDKVRQSTGTIAEWS